MRLLSRCAVGMSLLLVALPLFAAGPGMRPQQFKVTPNIHFLKLPAGVYFGECVGVAVDSKGNIYVANRGKHPLMEFHPDGTIVGVASCPCAAALPPPVSADQSGPAVLFPRQPALTVEAGAAGAAPASTPLKPTPPPRPHHNFLVRFVRWLIGKP